MFKLSASIWLALTTIDKPDHPEPLQFEYPVEPSIHLS